MKVLAPLDLKALLSPVSECQPAGNFDEESDAFQHLDHQMVKLGSLQEPAIDWHYIDEAAQRYLRAECKHMRVAGHLLTARLHAGGWRGWTEAAAVLAGMVEGYWESSYPRPGAAGLVAKRRHVGQLLDRLSENLAVLTPTGYGEEFYKAGQAALDTLQCCAQATQLDVRMLARLEGLLRQKAEASRAPELADSGSAQPSRADTLSDAFFEPVLPTPGNEREGRKSLHAIAELINQQDPYDPAGYLLRRFAMWAHLTSAPSGGKQNLTELMAVPADVAEGYTQALNADAVDLKLLQRVERSVCSSPYWIRGSYLAAQIAHRLDMPLVADAVHCATERFVTRLPALLTLAFADARPFVDGQTLAWISGEGTREASAIGHDYSALREELQLMLDTQGVEPTLRRLERIQLSATDLRHACHLMAIAAELLDARGLSWLADGLFTRALHAMQNATAPQWEPDLFRLLEQRTSAATETRDQ